MKTIEHIERVYSTKPARYIVGAIEFLFAWCLVAVVVGLLISYFFPPARGQERIFIFGWDWRNLPGAVLGLFTGFQAFRSSVRGPGEKESFSSAITSIFQTAGGIPGLRRRVARNRVIALSVLLLVLFSALFVYFHHH